MLWDISPSVSAASPVFPGDTPYRHRWTAVLGTDGAANVGEVTMSTHIGAHADAPLHYDADGAAIGQVALAPYLGHCRVIHAIGCGPLIELAHLAHALDGLPPRVLVRTCQSAPVDRWKPDLTAFAPDTIERLGSLGVKLIGIDSASIDPAESTTLDSHQVVRRLDMRILENLVLDAVPEGDYELIALPLKLVDADASPVRAVLRALPGTTR